jgi:demethylmenaquinone methyltransferase/2-methoxy-6-polyprenyl-1,4-benzoquinol methylase
MGEILRVLKPGGRFIIIETSQPEKRWINRLFHFYMRYIVPKLGGRISGHRGAYHYLAYSAINYYSILEMKQFLERNHFKGFAAHSLLGGIASIYEVSK